MPLPLLVPVCRAKPGSGASARASFCHCHYRSLLQYQSLTVPVTLRRLRCIEFCGLLGCQCHYPYQPGPSFPCSKPGLLLSPEPVPANLLRPSPSLCTSWRRCGKKPNCDAWCVVISPTPNLLESSVCLSRIESRTSKLKGAVLAANPSAPPIQRTSNSLSPRPRRRPNARTRTSLVSPLRTSAPYCHAVLSYTDSIVSRICIRDWKDPRPRSKGILIVLSPSQPLQSERFTLAPPAFGQQNTYSTRTIEKEQQR